MSVPARKKSSSSVRRRRSHHFLSKVELVLCVKCNEAVQPHRACKNCGTYKGRNAVANSKDTIQLIEKSVKEKAKKTKKEVKKTEKEAKKTPKN